MEELIIASAILHKGFLYLGPRHHDCIREIKAKTGERTPATSVQGFITETGRFLNRVEAAKLALENGQVKELKFNHHRLFSEDLW